MIRAYQLMIMRLVFAPGTPYLMSASRCAWQARAKAGQ